VIIFLAFEALGVSNRGHPAWRDRKPIFWFSVRAVSGSPPWRTRRTKPFNRPIK